MRKGLWVLVLALTLALGPAAVGCSGGGGETSGSGGAKTPGARASGRPAEEGVRLDRAAHVLAGLSEGPFGTLVREDARPGEGGSLTWRDVAGEEPDGHQLAYVTEGILTSGRSGDGGDGPEDPEMVAQTDAGFAVLVSKGDPEVETLQWEDFEARSVDRWESERTELRHRRDRWGRGHRVAEACPRRYLIGGRLDGVRGCLSGKAR